MDLVALLAIQVLYAIASLALISVGLAIIFGMMRVINLAHGEFLMLGGYAAIAAAKAGINIYLAMLVIAPPLICGPTELDDLIDRVSQVLDRTTAWLA